MSNPPLTYISLFSGIGGFDLAFDRAGLRCVAQVENDADCQAVLQRHWPDVPKFSDVREVGKHNLPYIARRIVITQTPNSNSNRSLRP